MITRNSLLKIRILRKIKQPKHYLKLEIQS